LEAVPGPFQSAIASHCGRFSGYAAARANAASCCPAIRAKAANSGHGISQTLESHASQYTADSKAAGRECKLEGANCRSAGAGCGASDAVEFSREFLV